MHCFKKKNREKKFKMLNDGDNVSFDVEIDENGLGKAINVVVIGE